MDDGGRVMHVDVVCCHINGGTPLQGSLKSSKTKHPNNLQHQVWVIIVVLS
jgi:hypothetical protein